MNTSPNPPKPPLTRVLNWHLSSFSMCSKCGSSERKKYEWLIIGFGKIIGCIQPECENHWLDKKNNKK